MTGSLTGFREVVLADFEFTSIAGERPVPVCLVAHELKSGRWFRVWLDQLTPVPACATGRTPVPPYATGPDVLFIAHYASAELGCYRVLGWPMPERILDTIHRIPQSHKRPARTARRPACSAP